MQIIVKTYTGKTFTLNVKKSHTIDTVKAKIFKQGFRIKKQQPLIFEGRQLDDDSTVERCILLPVIEIGDMEKGGGKEDEEKGGACSGAHGSTGVGGTGSGGSHGADERGEDDDKEDKEEADNNSEDDSEDPGEEEEEDELTIYIKKPDGTVTDLLVTPFMQVKFVKVLLRNKTGIPPNMSNACTSR